MWAGLGWAGLGDGRASGGGGGCTASLLIAWRRCDLSGVHGVPEVQARVRKHAAVQTLPGERHPVRRRGTRFAAGHTRAPCPPRGLVTEQRLTRAPPPSLARALVHSATRRRQRRTTKQGFAHAMSSLQAFMAREEWRAETQSTEKRRRVAVRVVPQRTHAHSVRAPTRPRAHAFMNAHHTRAWRHMLRVCYVCATCVAQTHKLLMRGGRPEPQRARPARGKQRRLQRCSTVGTIVPER